MSASSRNGHLEDDHSDGDSLISVTSEEFPHYFIEREGRLFHSSPTAPYPLPVDTPEQERLNVQHEALLRVIGRHYVGPVPQALVSEDDVTKCVVDFCCGNGRWVLDMASQFPEVSFIGLDIVPIATRNPPANVMFEIHDIQSPTRFPDGSVDCVHARFCSMAVRDYDLLVREASRILRPGGVFVFGEMLRLAVFHPTVVDQNPRVAVPNFCTFYDLLNERLRRHGIQHVSDSVPLRLGNIGTFSEITPIAYNLPECSAAFHGVRTTVHSRAGDSARGAA